MLRSHLSPQFNDLSFHFSIARSLPNPFEVLIDLAFEIEPLAPTTCLVCSAGADDIAAKLLLPAFVARSLHRSLATVVIVIIVVVRIGSFG